MRRDTDIMFNQTEMEKIVALQAKSFALLQWVRTQVNAQTLDAALIENTTAFYPVALGWITRNLPSFPPETRPDFADLEPFAHLFVSFLSTSFVIPPTQEADAPAKRVPEQWARYFVPPSRLRVRTPGKKAGASAQQMKDLYLTHLAEGLRVLLPYSEREDLATSAETARSVSLASYGRELIRRSEFASSGEGVLVLWREFAWVNGKLNKKFVLSAVEICNAEAQIAAQITRR